MYHSWVQDGKVASDRFHAANAWPKRCACGATYDRESWERLVLVAHASAPGTDWAGLEMRNCACGSTLAIESEKPEGSRER
jgi:hypothetical protein